MSMNWIRVSRKSPCVICGKPDWCSRSKDGTTAFCPRVKSDRPAGNGFLHKLADDWIPPRYLPISAPRSKPNRDWRALAEKYRRAMTDKGVSILSQQLGLSVDVLRQIQVGWDGSRSQYTFPMRNAAGDVVGLRTRSKDGKKSISGSDGNGLFFIPSELAKDYLNVCEGPTDMCALVDAGFGSSIGKPSCKLGDNYVVELIQRLNPQAVLLIPDRDVAGREGFSNLANSLLRRGTLPFVQIDVLTPPKPFNDVREWLQKNREHLAGQVAAKIEAIKQCAEASNDQR